MYNVRKQECRKLRYLYKAMEKREQVSLHKISMKRRQRKPRAKKDYGEFENRSRENWNENEGQIKESNKRDPLYTL